MLHHKYAPSSQAQQKQRSMAAGWVEVVMAAGWRPICQETRAPSEEAPLGSSLDSLLVG